MSGEYIRRPGHRGQWAPPSDEPLNTVDHTNFTVLMSLTAFKGQPRIALAGFKKRWNKSQWMQAQRGYDRRACLAAASGLPQGASFCRCGLSYHDGNGEYRFQTCGQDGICPSCNKNNRVERCQHEYLPAFDRAPYWYAGSVGWQSSPRKAGLHWVTKQDANGRATAKKHWRPFANRPDAPHTARYGLDSMHAMQLMAELPFRLADQLVKRGWFDGMYCVFEWDLAFYPERGGTGCFHTALPHLHFFGNRTQPLTFGDGKEIQRLYQRTCTRLVGEEKLPSYPDLELAPIVSQCRLKGWINYEVKAMPLEKFYREGIRNGCPIKALNLEFHQTVWDAIKLVRSPRKYGNLFALDPGYIGDRQYNKLTKRYHESLTQKEKDGVPLTPKEARQLQHHELACAQAKQHQREKRHRQEQARLRRPDLAN